MFSVRRGWLLVLSSVLFGCASVPGPWYTPARQPLTDAALAKIASAAPLRASEARVYTDNDQAFLSKLHLVEEAHRSIDLAYYIYADDYSSSYMTRALIAAARRGVAVRLLVDYQTNYKNLDLFSMMEAQGAGNLRVRLYGRPTRHIVEDAVYLTLACDKDSAAKRPMEACAAQKFDRIDAMFAQESIDGRPAAPRDISNLALGNSGLFLSGYYAKHPDAMALAIQTGQGVDPAQSGGQKPTGAEKQVLEQVATDWWHAHTGNEFLRLTSRARLGIEFAVFGAKLNPLADMVDSLIPAGRPMSAQEKRDWDHITDYSHHKFLWVDGTALQMGGRNVEDSYHMHPNALTEKYVFMDTDVYVQLAAGAERVTQAFEELWGFDRVVATLAEVRMHAPNDFVANVAAMDAAKNQCQATPTDADCFRTAFAARAKSLAQRIDERWATLNRRADTYATQYLPAIAEARSPTFVVDRGASFAYLENLPYDRALPPASRTRTYGASVGAESAGGKNIHEAWLRELDDVCRAATREHPKRIILHNAYFYPGANYLYGMSRLANGDLDCSNVRVTVITNSIETTDLSVVNLLARHSMKAFAEFYRDSSDPKRRARFEYFEYVPVAGGPNLSLHTKTTVFGDDIVIGSANADVRSFMMDSNNAMLIRNAPSFLQAYVSFVDGILAQPGRVRRLDRYFLDTPREIIKREDLETLRGLLTKYHAERHLDAKSQAELEAKFVALLDDAYELTRDSIATDGTAPFHRRQLQDEFDDLFKPI
jgi:cardiolipin synthase C